MQPIQTVEISFKGKNFKFNHRIRAHRTSTIPETRWLEIMKLFTGEDLHRDTINFRILGYSIFLAFVSVILAITLMKRYCECCYDDPKRTDDLNISYWLLKIYAFKDNCSCSAINSNAKYVKYSYLYWWIQGWRIGVQISNGMHNRIFGYDQFLFKRILVFRRQLRQKREVCFIQIARWHIGQWRRQWRVLHSWKN